MPKNLVFREFPDELPPDYRVSLANAGKLIFNIPLALVRGFGFGWRLAQEEAQKEDNTKLDLLFLMLAGLLSAPFGVFMVVSCGLGIAARGRLLHVAFEESDQ